MSKVCVSLPVLLALLVWPCHAIAQQDQGTITGLIRDTTGAVLPSAAVSASDVDTGVSTQTIANSEGLYTLPALKVGHYRIIAEMRGFKRGVSDVVEVHAQGRLHVDFELQLGSVDQEISVLATAPLLETGTSALGHVIREEQIPELPL